MGSVSAFVLFFLTFYTRKAELADFFFFFYFNGHTVWRIHSWKLLSSTTVLHCCPLTSNVRPSASFKGTLSTDKSTSLFRLCWFSQLGFKLAPFLIPACISNLLDLKCVCVIKQLRLYCRHSTVWHVLCRVPVGWALDFTSLSLPRASHVCHAGLLSSRETFFTV